MSTSIAQSRQQLSALIAAAQQAPQVITKRSTPVAVLVSADYFRQSQAAIKPAADTFYSQLMQLRQTYAPDDEAGLTTPGAAADACQAAWTRVNPFTTAFKKFIPNQPVALVSVALAAIKIKV
ncbi:MAG: type II toxin-antitoxin system Phd/YefM family antitoxin [Rhodoferax sp.]|jgi:prevent-host-death family protein|nr:type II toxin-antitoxin system Phd/YefM family antitoxin [Rhodoferax sp.]